MKYLFIIIATFFTALSFSQNIYIYADIPDSIKKNADYIVWKHCKEFYIKDRGRAIDKEFIAVCIKDQHSKIFNDIEVLYGKGEAVTSFKAEIFDAQGNFVKRLKKLDIIDNSAVSGFSLFEDTRVMYAEFFHNTYPYTLVFEYEKKVEGLLNLPTWDFQRLPNSGVISSKFEILTPENITFKYRSYNLSNEPIIVTENKIKKYSWEEKNLTPKEYKEKSPPIIYYKPVLFLAPASFSEGEYEGSLETWNSYGKWFWHLNQERDKLPEETKKIIIDLTKDAKTDKEKVKIIYQFMQNKTRYVSVQLGIGGYQTFPAEYVDSKGYGDCKALSNYTYSLLKEVSVKSYFTLVNAGRGEDDILYDFPCHQFNHAILCVPLKSDTIWLECTDQKKPFNFLGSFTDDRHVIMVTEEGGKLVKTPRYRKEVNTQYRNIELKLDTEGNAKAKVHTEFSGLQYENREGWSGRSVKEQKDALKENYAISGMEINNFKFMEFKDEIPSIHEDLDLNILRFASTSGKRMFIKMNVFNQASYVPKNEERKIPFRLTYEFMDADTLNFEIPDGYTIENQPKDYDLATKFGTYSCKFEQNGNKIRFIRNYSSEKGIFPAEDYKDYYEFRKTIKKADKAKLVLVKKI